MPVVEILPEALLVDKVVPKDGVASEVEIKQTTVNVKDDDMPISAGFISKFPKYQVFLIPYKYIRASQGDGYERVPNTAVRIVFRSFRREVKNQKLLELILASKPFRRNRIMIDPDDASRFWQKQGWLKKKTIQVVDRTLVPSGADQKFDLSKVKADPKPEAKPDPKPATPGKKE